jgi:hypothetical protein
MRIPGTEIGSVTTTVRVAQAVEKSRSATRRPLRWTDVLKLKGKRIE